MNEQSKLEREASVGVEFVSATLSVNDLNDLCDATDAAIIDGGGFGWIDIPLRDDLENYWSGVVTAPTRELFVARLDGVIAGAAQVILSPKNNEAQRHMVTLTTNFIAPWARGYGLAKMLLEEVERKSAEDGFAVVNLDVRETMDKAIRLYEGLGYKQFGTHPYAVLEKGKPIQSRFYYKIINSDAFE